MDVAYEFASQRDAGTFQPYRLGATVGIGVVKALASKAVFALATVGTAAVLGALGVASAPAWIPIAVGGVAYFAAGYALDKANERWDISQKLSNAMQGTVSRISSTAQSGAQGVKNAAQKTSGAIVNLGASVRNFFESVPVRRR